MAPPSTLTLLGQTQTNESATLVNGSLKMTKSQLDLPADEFDGLRIRDSAKVSAQKGQQVITDENNNTVTSKPVEVEENKDGYRMWGFFRVDQPVKTLNSIMIPIVHLACIYALGNITLDTKWLTIGWGESHENHRKFHLVNYAESGQFHLNNGIQLVLGNEKHIFLQLPEYYTKSP